MRVSLEQRVFLRVGAAFPIHQGEQDCLRPSDADFESCNKENLRVVSLEVFLERLNSLGSRNLHIHGAWRVIGVGLIPSM